MDSLRYTLVWNFWDAEYRVRSPAIPREFFLSKTKLGWAHIPDLSARGVWDKEIIKVREVLE